METKYLRINPADNVAVAIVNLPAGEYLSVDGIEITLNEDIPAGHKFALKNFSEGENVIKYGYPIGHALMAKKQGDWMNETNIKTNLAGLLEYTYNPIQVSLDIPHKDLTFKGYRRKNGDVGVRNEIWIIPTVGCVNGIIGQLAEGLKQQEKVWMQSLLSHITTAAHSLATTMKIRKRFFVTWCFIPMQVRCW
jgi:altronate hydrolase